jgi:hypothetical protein
LCRCDVPRRCACQNIPGFVKAIPGSGENRSPSRPESLFAFSPESLSSSPRNRFHVYRRGAAASMKTTQKQRSNGKDLTFEFTPVIKDRVSDAMAALSGPFVQGPPDERFVYIDIGTFAGQVDSCWSRRLKIPLAGIRMKMVQAGNVLEVRVPGTGRDGSPSCAAVKDFKGWKLVKG